ncbi:MAG: type II secretion system protein [Planctomycetes bacterium]|nr:type II secretion system protein [Planctomycetota bacterium]
MQANVWARGRCARAFTLVEVIAVMVVLAIMAGVAIPRFFDYSDRARTSAVQGTLGGVRSGLANFFANEMVVNGAGLYPTLAELTTLGTVMQEALPNNPYNDRSTVETVALLADANARVNTGVTGWRYYVDNTATPPIAIFYANTNDTTTAPDGAGGFLDAHEL